MPLGWYWVDIGILLYHVSLQTGGELR